LGATARAVISLEEAVIARIQYQVDKIRINEQIKFHTREVRLIADDKQLGVVPVERALEEAARRDLDLVEVAPNAQPPVCKIMDYGKFRFEQTKREREARHHSHQVKTKEVKIRPSISDHDYATKQGHAIEFLKEGHRVKLTCFFRGRENAHHELGVALVNRFIGEVKDFGAVETPGKQFGNIYTTVLGPVKSKSHKPA
jgi:translation initiation factor IF-3